MPIREGHLYKFMNIHLASQTVHLCVKNLRNSSAITRDPCLNMNNLEYKLIYPGLIEVPLWLA